MSSNLRLLPPMTHPMKWLPRLYAHALGVLLVIAQWLMSSRLLWHATAGIRSTA